MALFDGLFKDFGIGDIIGGIGAGIGLFEAFSEPEVPGALKRSAKLMSRAQEALLDPDSELFQRIYQGDLGRGRRDYAYALDQAQRSNRRAVARTGGLGMINPERRDEFAADIVKRGYPEAADAARASTRAYLQAVMGANSAVTGAYQPIIAAQQQGQANRLGGLESLIDFGGYLDDRLLNGGQNISINVPRDWSPMIYGT